MIYNVLQAGDYTPLSELSLDASSIKDDYDFVGDTLIPDLSVYPKRGFVQTRDILRMQEMPLLVIEILSPMQALQPLTDKFDAYFALGIHSGWLVNPVQRTIAVFTAPYQSKLFHEGTLVDERLSIELSIDEIFE